MINSESNDNTLDSLPLDLDLNEMDDKTQTDNFEKERNNNLQESLTNDIDKDDDYLFNFNEQVKPNWMYDYENEKDVINEQRLTEEVDKESLLEFNEEVIPNSMYDFEFEDEVY